MLLKRRRVRPQPRVAEPDVEVDVRLERGAQVLVRVEDLLVRVLGRLELLLLEELVC